MTRLIYFLNTLTHMSGRVFWNITKVKKIKALLLFFRYEPADLENKKVRINKHFKKCFS